MAVLSNILRRLCSRALPLSLLLLLLERPRTPPLSSAASSSTQRCLLLAPPPAYACTAGGARRLGHADRQPHAAAHERRAQPRAHGPPHALQGVAAGGGTHAEGGCDHITARTHACMHMHAQPLAADRWAAHAMRFLHACMRACPTQRSRSGSGVGSRCPPPPPHTHLCAASCPRGSRGPCHDEAAACRLATVLSAPCLRI